MIGDSLDDTIIDSPIREIEVAVRSVIAPRLGMRAENQDNYLVIDADGSAAYLRDESPVRGRISGWPTGHRRFAVLDGVGGHDHGRMAAERTVEGLLDIPAVRDLRALSEQLEALHDRLHAEFAGIGGNAGCTLTLVEIPEKGPAMLFHTGDSRLYRIDANTAVCLTVDHVPATQWAMSGEIDSPAWQRHVHERRSSAISQAFILGHVFLRSERSGPSPKLLELNDSNLPAFLQGKGDRRYLDLTPGVMYLLASDGLWHVPEPKAFSERWPALVAEADGDMNTAVDTLLAALTDLVARQQLASGDNTTLLAFRAM
ncbi:MAG: protein phosphatase [Gammaproteobacteria bacterium]|nr:protein phosphatase [Gammaproteobacteria bacterium]MCP5135476.1 protein phosphatase [Gammaproteobacteria bacterium]